MPFGKELDMNQIIKGEKAKDPDFQKAWDGSRSEYDLLHDIVKKRKELKLSQTELARLMGCRQQDISNFERKAHKPSFDFICRLVDCLGFEFVLRKKRY